MRSLWWVLKQYGIFIGRGDQDIDTHRKSCEDTGRRQLFTSQGVKAQQNPSCLSLDFRFVASRTVRKYILSYKPHSVWCLYTQYLLCTRHGSKWFTSIESWTVKKAECQRIDAFELWCWRRVLGVESPLDIKEIQTVSPIGNQS